MPGEAHGVGGVSVGLGQWFPTCDTMISGDQKFCNFFPLFSIRYSNLRAIFYRFIIIYYYYFNFSLIETLQIDSKIPILRDLFLFLSSFLLTT